MKKFLIVVTAVLAVLLVVAVVLPLALKGRIDGIVKREADSMLNAHLDFKKLNISLLRHFPYASLELKELTLTGVGRFEGDTILSADRISVVVDVMSLFGDEGFEVTKVAFVRPTVRARKLADGAVNWDLMRPAPQQPIQSEVLTTPAEPSSFRFLLRDVRISEASLHYEDDSTHVRFSATPLSLRLRGDMSASETDLALRLKAGNIRLVSGSMSLLSGMTAELDAVVMADLVNKKFTFANNTVRLNAIGVSLDGWVDLSDSDAVKMNITAGCGKVQFKDVLSVVPIFYMNDFKNLTASGELSLSAWVRGELRGRLLPVFEITLGVKEGSFHYSSLPKSVTDINIRARIAGTGGTLDNTTLEVPEFSLMMAGNALRASLTASHPLSDPRFSAAAAGKLDLGSIRKVYPLAKGVDLNGLIMADVKVGGRLSDIEAQRYESVDASGTFVVEQVTARLGGVPDVRIVRAAATITPAAMILGDFRATVGRSDLTANGQLTGYIGYLLDGMPLSGRLYVKSSLLDMNEIMAVPTIATDGAQTAVADTTALSIPVLPTNLNLSLSTDVHTILLGEMTISDFTGQLHMNEGTLSLERLSMKAFGGSMLASGSYSTAADPRRPYLRLALDIAQASFARTFDELEVVQQLVPLFRKTGGDYSMTLDMTTSLDSTMSPDLTTLDARGELRSSNIRIQQIEAFAKLAEALNDDKLRTIDARDVTIRFSVADGRIATQPFDLKMGDVNLNLSGTTGLDQTIDYVARVSLPAGGMLSTLDVHIGGTFTAPKITLGLQDAVRDAVTNLVNKQVKKLTGNATLEEIVDKQKQKHDAAVER